MVVYLMQHGKALSKQEDPARPLSAEGSREVDAVARAAAAAGVTADRVFHSGKERARQTAEQMARTLSAPVECWTDLEATRPVAPLGAALCKLVGEGRKAVLLVGHLPSLEHLLGKMVTGDEQVRILEFRNGALIRLNPQEDGSYRIAWTLLPEFVQG